MPFCILLFLLWLKMEPITRSYLKDLTYRINGAAIEVHQSLGPGLLENVYHRCLVHELKLRRIDFDSERFVQVHYKNIEIDAHLRCDLYIENCIVVELKAHENILPVHEAQLITYMKLLKAPKGIIYNFNVASLYNEGQKTYVNEFFTNLHP